ncbi:MAG TPA: hypothetical protein VGR59_00390, partial [Gemmatimonadaceae bacterium]|nr:hypothetical protein [Gemmatimonadaceae bacterium]
TIGDMCYWDDNGDAPLPPERPRIARARDHLRSSLDSLGAIDSANDYIVGQRVRYAVEAGDAAGAIAIVAHCAATPWWCAALRGFAYHRAGVEAASAAAFDSALSAMPDSLRCKWLDVRPWIPSGTRADSSDDASDCAARAEMSRRVFWLSAPLLTWRRDAVRDELFSRRTQIMLLSGTANPQFTFWRWDSEALSLRYGWPDQWAREDNPIGSIDYSTVRVVGDEPRPSFSVVPSQRALESPFTSRPGDWHLIENRSALMRYAPRWLRSIDTLPVQIARFRHGDSMVVVAAFDAQTLIDSGSTAMIAAASLSTGLAAESTLAIGLTMRAPVGAIVLVAPAHPSLGAVEVFDSVGGRAARWRAGIAPLPESAAISDLVVGRAGSAFDARTPEDAARVAIPTLRVNVGDTLALYWETYVRPPPATPVRTTVRLTRAAGFFGRVFGHKHMGPALSWEDAYPDPSPGRSIRFGLAGVPPGRYHLEVTVQTGQAHGTATREIDVVD